jgi:hypothetical protein
MHACACWSLFCIRQVFQVEWLQKFSSAEVHEDGLKVIYGVRQFESISVYEIIEI